jgi:hypothetical protein
VKWTQIDADKTGRFVRLREIPPTQFTQGTIAQLGNSPSAKACHYPATSQLVLGEGELRKISLALSLD